MQTNLIYLFDPLCGWCYGATTNINLLANDQDFKLEVYPTGLFMAENACQKTESFVLYIWQASQQIQQKTGQEFSLAYNENVLQPAGMFDSEASSLAILAAKYLDYPVQQQLAILKLLQLSCYVEGLNISKLSVVTNILEKNNYSELAILITEPDNKFKQFVQQILTAAQELMQINSIRGVPALLRNQQLIDSNLLFIDYNQAKPKLML